MGFPDQQKAWPVPLSKFHSISSKILLFLRSDPLFTPYGVIIFYSVDAVSC